MVVVVVGVIALCHLTKVLIISIPLHPKINNSSKWCTMIPSSHSPNITAEMMVETTLLLREVGTTNNIKVFHSDRVVEGKGGNMPHRHLTSNLYPHLTKDMVLDHLPCNINSLRHIMFLHLVLREFLQLW